MPYRILKFQFSTPSYLKTNCARNWNDLLKTNSPPEMLCPQKPWFMPHTGHNVVNFRLRVHTPKNKYPAVEVTQGCTFQGWSCSIARKPYGTHRVGAEPYTSDTSTELNALSMLLCEILSLVSIYFTGLHHIILTNETQTIARKRSPPTVHTRQVSDSRF